MITDGTYKGASLHEAIAQAVDIYNDLTNTDKAAVSEAYAQLKTAIAAYNEDSSKVNSDADSTRELFLPGALVGISLLAFAGYSLFGKKFF